MNYRKFYIAKVPWKNISVGDEVEYRSRFNGRDTTTGVISELDHVARIITVLWDNLEGLPGADRFSQHTNAPIVWMGPMTVDTIS